MDWESAARGLPGDAEMSLRAFHLVFIAASVILAAFVAAWAVGQYRVEHDAIYLAASAACLTAAVGLAVYATAFQRKTRQL
jgi:hypothetical protein